VKTALDTNALQAILEQNHPFHGVVLPLLARARAEGQLLACGVVYAEALSIPGLSRADLDEFFEQLGAVVVETLSRDVWARAGAARSLYLERRRKLGVSEPKRLLSDFIIGSHALEEEARLLSFDPAGYRAAFPTLVLLPSS